MKLLFRMFVFSLAAQFLLSIGQAQAQPDPANVLIGIWEGTVAIPRDNQREIVFKSVKPKEGGGWVAEGTYKANTPQRITADVTQEGNNLLVDFIVGSSKNPVNLKLVGDRKLEGSLDVVASGGRTVKRSMTLEKVEPK